MQIREDQFLEMSFTAHIFKRVGFELYERVTKQNDPIDTGELVLLIPAIVNIAFATEIRIKYILLKNGKKIKGHKLKELFNLLPNEIRNSIKNNVSNSLKNTSENSPIGDFCEELEKCSDYFIGLRYSYESPYIPVTVSKFIYLLSKALFEIEICETEMSCKINIGDKYEGHYTWSA